MTAPPLGLASPSALLARSPSKARFDIPTIPAEAPVAINMNTPGVHETLDKDYVAFKDPDRIAWEFYMA